MMVSDRKDLKISKNRLEALVDGIFAFAMTLLVTGLVIPHFSKTEAEAKLLISIAELRSEFISFLVAFFVLASFWHLHNRQFYHVRKVDSGTMRITLLILVCVVLMPFTTYTSGAYSNVQVAVGIFHANMFGLGLFFLAHWRHLTKNPDVRSAEISSREATLGMWRSLIIPVVSVLGFLLSLVSPSLSTATYLLIIPCVAVLKRLS